MEQLLSTHDIRMLSNRDNNALKFNILNYLVTKTLFKHHGLLELYYQIEKTHVT